MGYTHYWNTQKSGIPQEQWDLICRDVTTLLNNLPQHSKNAGGYHSDDPLEIAWENDQPDKLPEISAKLIRFNGKDGGNDLGHETFYLLNVKPEAKPWQEDDGTVFAFCKTARKPYDLVVCGVLIVIAKHAKKFVKISSDGDKEDWVPALEWVTSILGSGYRIPTPV